VAVARAAGAVLPSWSNMDVSVKAYLTDDVTVYVGKGATQYRDELPNGMYVTLTGWPAIDQVYVPGMRGPSYPAYTAFRVIRKKTTTTLGFGFPG
jgi:hypothetical protein